jgi:pimeloyl-ACP methyl ester carboxylesterase
MSGISEDADTQGELVSFTTADDVRLHGALYTNSRVPSHDIAVIGTHGSGASFYTSVTGFLCPALPSHGYTALSMNMRSHDRFDAQVTFEGCEQDFAAGVKFMREQGFKHIVLFGHSFSVTQIAYFMAQAQEPAVVGLALSAGHDDLRSLAALAWETLVDDPKAEAERVLAQCRELVAQGDGDRLIIIPWWRPDPKLNLRQQYREISAQTYVSNWAPESNCNASLWISQIEVPMLFIAHSVVDTTARPEMMQRLRELATKARSTEYVNIEGSGHFYVGYQDQFIGAVAGWLEGPRNQGADYG